MHIEMELSLCHDVIYPEGLESRMIAGFEIGFGYQDFSNK